MSEETLTIRCPHDGCLRVFHLDPHSEEERRVLNLILEKQESALVLRLDLACPVCERRFLRYGWNLVPCSCDLPIHPEETAEQSPRVP
jgi:hypothetical protein